MKWALASMEGRYMLLPVKTVFRLRCRDRSALSGCKQAWLAEYTQELLGQWYVWSHRMYAWTHVVSPHLPDDFEMTYLEVCRYW